MEDFFTEPLERPFRERTSTEVPSRQDWPQPPRQSARPARKQSPSSTEVSEEEFERLPHELDSQA